MSNTYGSDVKAEDSLTPPSRSGGGDLEQLIVPPRWPRVAGGPGPVPSNKNISRRQFRGVTDGLFRKMT